MSSTSFPLIINKTHHVGGSTFEYKFGNSINMTDVTIALEKATVWFSWQNITANKNNNKFSIIHPTFAGTSTINLTIPDGGYNIDDINKFLRWSLIQAGYYIQNNSTLEQTVYCSLVVNPSTYQIQFISYPLPTSLPSGFTAGSSLTFPVSAKGPQLIVPANNFGTVIGFDAGTFPSAQPTSISTTGSSSIPIVSDVQNVVVTLDSAFNKFSSTNSKVIHSFSPAGVSYSKLITSEPKSLSFVPQQSGWRDSITIQLCDQFLRPLNMIDNDITVILQLRHTV